jgi:hypothetical protein
MDQAAAVHASHGHVKQNPDSYTTPSLNLAPPVSWEAADCSWPAPLFRIVKKAYTPAMATAVPAQSSVCAGIQAMGRHDYGDNVGTAEAAAGTAEAAAGTAEAAAEQVILQGLLTKGESDAAYSPLNRCTYASGQWYDPANVQLRETCLVRHGPPIVINNN